MEHRSIYLVDRIDQRNEAVIRGEFGIFLFAFKDHDNVGKAPRAWRRSRGEHFVIMREEKQTKRAGSKLP